MKVQYSYLVRIVDLAVFWVSEAVIFVQDHNPDVDNFVLPRKSLVEWYGQVIEGCDSCVRKA